MQTSVPCRGRMLPDKKKKRKHKDFSGLSFCRAFVVMNFQSESVDFVMDFYVNFFCGFLGAFCPFKRRTENPQRNPQRNSRQNPCKIHACSEKRRKLSGTSVETPKSRYTPPNQGVAPFSGPPCCTFLSFPAGRGCGGLEEGIAALLGSENGSRYRGASQLQSHQSRYSVQTKGGKSTLQEEEPEIFGLL